MKMNNKINFCDAENHPHLSYEERTIHNNTVFKNRLKEHSKNTLYPQYWKEIVVLAYNQILNGQYIALDEFPQGFSCYPDTEIDICLIQKFFSEYQKVDLFYIE